MTTVGPSSCGGRGGSALVMVGCGAGPGSGPARRRRAGCRRSRAASSCSLRQTFHPAMSWRTAHMMMRTASTTMATTKMPKTTKKAVFVATVGLTRASAITRQGRGAVTSRGHTARPWSSSPPIRPARRQTPWRRGRRRAAPRCSRSCGRAPRRGHDSTPGWPAGCGPGSRTPPTARRPAGVTDRARSCSGHAGCSGRRPGAGATRPRPRERATSCWSAGVPRPRPVPPAGARRDDRRPVG